MSSAREKDRVSHCSGWRIWAEGATTPDRTSTEIPEIFAEETLQVAQGLAQEGIFYPVLAASSRVTEGLEASPPLRGYLLAKAKSNIERPTVDRRVRSAVGDLATRTGSGFNVDVRCDGSVVGGLDNLGRIRVVLGRHCRGTFCRRDARRHRR